MTSPETLPAGTDGSRRVWAAPEPRGPEVRILRGSSGRLWSRVDDAPAGDEWTALPDGWCWRPVGHRMPVWGWSYLLTQETTLTDATGEQ